MNESEVNFIREEMKNNLSLRTTLLTFSFTAVITTIGFGISNFNSVPFWVYIMPVIITIVFSARITYYKDRQAKMNAYLWVYYSDSVKMDEKYKSLENGFCAKNKLESFLITYELLVLSVLCCVLYYVKLDILAMNITELIDVLAVFAPVLLIVLQFYILHKFPSYYKKTQDYIKYLKNVRNCEEEQRQVENG